MDRDLRAAILAMAAATYLTRCLALVCPSLPHPGTLRRGPRYIPAGVLGALVAPALLAPRGHLIPPWQDPELLAGLAAGVVAVRTRSILLTMVAGAIAALVFRRVIP
ncbi:MAG: AzlD domain-containing protein [Bacillota bacterium]|nr:AzlD domain-containing protein [Bacillota bacterium]